jgi:23S rRNA pseudouridine1911/1915/1917 synthase
MSDEKFDISRLEGSSEEYRFTAGEKEAGARLDAALAGRYRWLSRSEAKKRIGKGKVAVNAAPVSKGSFRLSIGDRVIFDCLRNPRDEEAARRAPPGEDLTMLFEDECLLVVDKPAGIPVHPVGRNLYRTVLTALHRRCAAAGTPEERMPTLAHRLDVETSGVLLAVKGKEEAARVAEQFSRHTVRKEYRALVYDTPAQAQGVIDAPLGPAEGARVPYRQAVRADGSPARTHYAVERSGTRLSLLRLRPETGRKHQLRIHLASIGHPIVGDKIYGPDEEHYFRAREGPPSEQALEELILPRQALHASALALRHPRSEEDLLFEAPLAADIRAVLEAEL